MTQEAEQAWVWTDEHDAIWSALVAGPWRDRADYPQHGHRAGDSGI